MLFESCKFICWGGGKVERHNKQKQKIDVILRDLEHLDFGHFCSCGLNCGIPGFEKLQSLVELENCVVF